MRAPFLFTQEVDAFPGDPTTPATIRFKPGQSYLAALRPPHQVQLFDTDGHGRIRDTELLGQ